MAGNNIRGITIDIGGNTEPLKNALKGVDKTSRDLASELKLVEKGLKLDPKNTVLLQQKQELLAKSIATTGQKLETLKEAERQAQIQFAQGRINEEQYRALQREVISTENALHSLETQAVESNSTLLRVGEASDRIAKGADKVGKAMLPATVAIVGLGAVATKSGSDYIESLNKVEVAFGENAKEVEAWSKTTLDKFGMAEGSALEMASLFGDMGTAMGLTTGEASKMSMSLTGLGADLASFKNISLEQSQTALKGIFTGEGEALKTLGIVMQESTLIEYAHAKGITTKYKEMSQSEKVNLRYNFVMEKTKNAQGDFTRTSDGAANSMRTTSESVKELSASMGTILAPLVAELAQHVADLAKSFAKVDDSTKKTILIILGLIASIAPIAFIISKIATAIGFIIPLLVTVSGGIGILTGTTLVATPAMTAFAGAITFMLGPVGIAIGIIAGLALVVGSIALKHKKQSEEVKKTEEAYKKFNETLSNGSTKDLKEYEKTLEGHQKMLSDLRKKMEDYKTANNNIGYNASKRDLEDYITVIKKQGFSYDETTGKIIELEKLQNRINTQSQLDKVTEVINKRVEENGKITTLIDRYNKLNDTKKRTKAEDIELSNTAKELNSKYNDLKISIDKNGNAVITNVGLLDKKKEALEIDTQMIKTNAFEQAKSAIYGEEIEVGKTKTTITEIEKRMKARELEFKSTAGYNGRQTAQQQAESIAYLDAYLRLKKIKEQISSTNIPQASGISDASSEKSGSGSKVSTFDVGIEATSKYSKVLVDLEQNLGKVDKNIEGIQNKIEVSKTIGTAEELAKATIEQNNLYEAQAQKISSLQNAEKILNDNKKKLIQEFKNSFGVLKNVDLNNWEESDFQNFIEKTYKQTTTTDKARADALKKGQQYTQELAKDLSALNSKIQSVGDSLVNTKKSQLQTLKELHEQEEAENKKLVDSVTKLGDSIKKSLIDRYKSEEQLETKSLNERMEYNKKLKDDTIKSIETVHNAKVKILDDELRMYDIANQDSDDKIKEAELRRLLAMHLGADKRKEVQKELDDLLKNQERRKYKESIEAQKEALKIQADKDMEKAENTLKDSEDVYKFLLKSNEDFYKEKTKQANIDAEVQKLIVSNNQTEIINLMKTYDSNYANVGMTLGESLVSAFRDKMYELTDVLNGVFDNINKSENIASISGSSASIPTSPITRSNNNNDIVTVIKSSLSSLNLKDNNKTIVVPVYLDGKTIATVTAPYSDKIGGSNLALTGRGL